MRPFPTNALPTVIEHRQEAACPTGAVVFLLGRPVKVIRRWAAMKGEMVTIEELPAVGRALPGQYGLWPADQVDRDWTEMLRGAGSRPTATHQNPARSPAPTPNPNTMETPHGRQRQHRGA